MAYASDLTNPRGWLRSERAMTAVVLLALAGAAVAGSFQLTGADAVLAVLFGAVGLAILAASVRAAIVYGLIWIFAKSFWLRLAFYLDISAGRDVGSWLGPAPAVFLAVICTYCLLRLLFSEGRRSWQRPAVWLVLFLGFVALSLFFPIGAWRVKLAGFERNIFPTMAMAGAGYWAFRRPEEWCGLTRALLVFGIVSVGYALWQHLIGLPPWERAWFEALNASAPTGLSGWLTVGASGLEFRVHSCYYSYTEFFFTTVGILLLNVMEFARRRDRLWRRLFIVFVVLFAWLLGETLERMPIVMLLCGGLAVWTLHAARGHFLRRVWKSIAIVIAVWLLALLSLSAYLDSGVDKLGRLAELTNPFAASSIQDRVSHQWTTTLTDIGRRPWGWGLGAGSQTQASAEAEQTGAYVQPHNEILQKTLELGLAGGVLFLALLISQFRWTVRQTIEAAVPDDRRRVLLGYAGVMVAFLVCGMVNLTFSGTMGMLFWTATGATWSLVRPARTTA